MTANFPVYSLGPAMPFRAVVLFCLFALLWASEVPTGVHPSNIVFYVAFKPFTCLDKSVTIPWDKVNDDYCDCFDGSDEPGTSACPDMKFYCPNTGHEGVFIPSSFVNDMVCDCCDGSDEYIGLVKCNNTCGAMAREREEQLQKRRKEIESGHQIYQEYVARKTIELAAEAKREAEEAQKRDLEEAKKQTSDESADWESDSEVPPSGEDKEEHSKEIEPDQIHENSLYDEKHEGGEDMQDDGWNPPKGVEGGASVPSEGDDSAQVVESYEPPSPPPPPPPPKPIDYGPDKGFMMLTEPSTGCLEVQNKEYIYSLCAFKEVRQRPRHHSTGGTLLGSWSGWVGHPEDSVHWSKEEKLAKLPYSEMLYDGGEQCWNGPSRSVKVKVVCGAQNRLMSAEEPSRCTYKMRLETPATCHHDPVKLMEMHTEL